jgi:hypothetical protein
MQRLPRLALTLVCLLVVHSAFWTAAKFAAALKRGYAEDVAKDLHRRPQVTVFSRQELHLTGAGVTDLGDGDSAYQYRYSGLRLLIRGVGRYFLLPNDWKPGCAPVIVLADSPSLRFEFTSVP